MKISLYYYIITLGLLLTLLTVRGNITNAYTFGMLSHDKSIDAIQNLQNNFKLNLEMVSFIWDDYDKKAINTLTNLSSTLGTGKIYHITLSPRHHTTKQVYQGMFDREYAQLFNHIKQHNLKVVFRTMHEMNGGWFPRSGDPQSFKQARIHIYQLSREAGLDQNQILFDFSTNGRDMPPIDLTNPHQQAALITCTITAKKATGCLTWEDYYPGDEYVDLMGVTFYNRGKATSDRQWLTPTQIMEEPQFRILARLKQKNKPIIIDEVGTTSIRYSGTYNRNTSLYQYEKQLGLTIKNERLAQLTSRAQNKPEIIGLSYFNVDRTTGLVWENPGEADRSIIDLDHGRFYTNALPLYHGGNKQLHTLFTTQTITNNIDKENSEYKSTPDHADNTNTRPTITETTIDATIETQDIDRGKANLGTRNAKTLQTKHTKD